MSTFLYWLLEAPPGSWGHKAANVAAAITFALLVMLVWHLVEAWRGKLRKRRH